MMKIMKRVQVTKIHHLTVIFQEEEEEEEEKEEGEEEVEEIQEEI